MAEISYPTAGDYAWAAAQARKDEIKQLSITVGGLIKRVIELEAQVVILQRRFNGYSHAVKKEISRSR